jgi:hypothetical protein
LANDAFRNDFELQIGRLQVPTWAGLFSLPGPSTAREAIS